MKPPTLSEMQCHCPWLALGLSILIALVTVAVNWLALL
jgi:hypothetical protein